jgi:hypothetical protein
LKEPEGVEKMTDVEIKLNILRELLDKEDSSTSFRSAILSQWISDLEMEEDYIEEVEYEHFRCSNCGCGDTRIKAKEGQIYEYGDFRCINCGQTDVRISGLKK